MSDAKLVPSKEGDDKNVKRNLPSWMSSKNNGKEQADARIKDKKPNVEATSHVKAHRGNTSDCGKISANMGGTASDRASFSKLMEGVIFVLSGFVNPERGMLRSQALDMGAEYRSDWTSDCSLLVCAFSNTPKFRQVEMDCGTIVSKEWISECYNQKKLVEIDPYLMHAGKPWRTSNNFHETREDQQNTLSGKPHKPDERKPHPKLVDPAVSESRAPKPAKKWLSPSKVKEWATDDLNKTISWLENQEESPDPSEVKKIAAEGIITCLQDAIEALEQNQDIGCVTEQWKVVPRVVKELAKFGGLRSTGKEALSKDDLSEQAITCKRIYETEFGHLDDSPVKSKKPKMDKGDTSHDDKTLIMSDDAGFDSDETIEMTEEEIDLACRTELSKTGNV